MGSIAAKEREAIITTAIDEAIDDTIGAIVVRQALYCLVAVVDCNNANFIASFSVGDDPHYDAYSGVPSPSEDSP